MLYKRIIYDSEEAQSCCPSCPDCTLDFDDPSY